MPFYLGWIYKKGQCTKNFFQVSTCFSNIFTHYIKILEIYNAFIISEPEFNGVIQSFFDQCFGHHKSVNGQSKKMVIIKNQFIRACQPHKEILKSVPTGVILLQSFVSASNGSQY